MHAPVDDKDVVRPPHLGVHVDDALPVALPAHLRGAEVMAAAAGRGDDGLGGGVGGHAEDTAGLSSVAEQGVDEGSQRLDVSFRMQQRLGGHLSRAGGGDGDGADRGGAVGEIDLGLEGVVGGSADGALNVPCLAVAGGLDAGPEVEALG